LAQLREYIDHRFDYMDRHMILKYCSLLKDLGMFFEDKEMIERLQSYFEKSYYLFELGELFQLMKLHAYCFYQSETFMQNMRDAVSVRVKQDEQLQKLRAQETLDFIEALSVSNKEDRAMSGNLARILKKSNHVFIDKEVPLFAISYFADFGLKISDVIHAKML
jgi:hypothetical protein